jgi:hypothetical protein
VPEASAPAAVKAAEKAAPVADEIDENGRPHPAGI